MFGASPQQGDSWYGRALGSAAGFIGSIESGLFNAATGKLSQAQKDAIARSNANDLIRASGGTLDSGSAFSVASADVNAADRLNPSFFQDAFSSLGLNTKSILSGFADPAGWSTTGIMVTLIVIVALYLLYRGFTR